MTRQRYERPQVVESGPAPEAVGEVVAEAVGIVVPPAFGRELTADEYGRAGDLEQAFAVHKKLAAGGRQVKMPAGQWASAFAEWRQQERN